MEDFNNLSPIPDDVDFDSEDVSLPRWKVDKDNGFFVNTMTGEQKEHLVAVVIRADKSRFCWPSEFDTTNKPVCYSVNGIFPVDQSGKFGAKVGNGYVCKGCPLAEWTQGQKPPCAISYNYLLLDTETEILSVLNLSRSRTKTARSLNSFWRLNGVMFSLLFYSEKTKTTKGSFYDVKFQISEKLTADVWPNFARKMLQTKTMLLTSSITDVDREELDEADLTENGQSGNFEF